MTPTQAGFRICLLIAGPLFGAWGVAVVRGTRTHGLLGFGAALVGSWAGWITAAVVAGALHPSYPHGGPSEAGALLYLLPGFVTGAFTIVYLRRRATRSAGSPAGETRGMPRSPSWKAGFALLVIAVPLLFLGIHHRAQEPARRALPFGAQQVHEWSDAVGSFPVDETSYCLKARITPAEFEAYARELQLVPGQAGGDWLGWSRDRQPAWFDPSPDGSATLVSRGSGQSSYLKAKYEGGWLYLEDFWLRKPSGP